MTLQPLTDMQKAGWNAFLTKLDRVMTGIDITVTGTDSRLAPAFSNLRTDDVSINYEWLDELTAKTTTTEAERRLNILGINYHEMAHEIYSKASMDLVPLRIHSTFNALEDGRIETLLGVKHPKIGKLLLRLVLQVQAKIGAPENFILLWGRRAFVPVHVLDPYEKLYREKWGNGITDKTKELIDTFIKAPDTKSQVRLAEELHALIRGTAIGHPSFGEKHHEAASDKHKKIPKMDQKTVEEALKDGDAKRARISEAIRRVRARLDSVKK